MTSLGFAQYSGIASALTGIGASYLRASQIKAQETLNQSAYNIARIQAETQAHFTEAQMDFSKAKASLAKVQGSKDSMMMLKNFNRTRASNVVMAAAQGRSGGSVNAIASASESQYNWDKDFSELSNEIEQSNYISQGLGLKSQKLNYETKAEQSRINSSFANTGASNMAFIGGVTKSISGAAQTIGLANYKIGG